LHCPNCGKEILDENAVSCPYCGKPLTVPAHQAKAIRSTSLPTAASVAIIMAATISALYGLLGTLNIVLELGRIGSNINLSFEILFQGFFGVLAFAFGLVAAIFTLKRRHFALSMFGTGVLLFFGMGFVIIEIWAMQRAGVLYGVNWIAVLINGLPVVVLSLLGVIFLGLSKDEFLAAFPTAPVQTAEVARGTSLPTAAGVVTVMAATISVIFGIFGIMFLVGGAINSAILFVGFFGVLAFAFGLTGAIFAFGRRHFALSMFGTGLVLFYGLGMMASVWIYQYGLLSIFVIIVVLPMIFLSLLGVVFLAVSRREFV
jgi:hypothetical protein